MTTKVRDGVIVRLAVEADVPALGEMASEFQTYLNTLDEPGEPGEPGEPAALTTEALRRDGFGDDPWFVTLLAEGAGTALMIEATRILRQRGGNLLQWTVWNRNPAAIALYQSLGATPAHDEILMMWPDTAWPAT